MVTTPELIAIRRGQIRQLVEAGSTAPQIAQTLNLRTTIVQSDLRALKLKPAKVGAVDRLADRNNELADQIRAQAEQGNKRSHIAKNLDISYSRLCNIMTAHNIPNPVRVPEHGTLKEYRSYNCRCRPCTSANTAEIARARAARKERLSPDSPVHGTVSGYNNHLCRCIPCTEASAGFYATYRDTPPQRTRRAWTADEDVAILDYKFTASDLSVILGRPIASITSRRTILRQTGAAIALRANPNRSISKEEARRETLAARHNEIASAAEAAKLAAAAESRRGAITTLVHRGLSRAQIMLTLDIGYETLQMDLQYLQLTPSRTGIHREVITHAAATRAPRGNQAHLMRTLAPLAA